QRDSGAARLIYCFMRDIVAGAVRGDGPLRDTLQVRPCKLTIRILLLMVSQRPIAPDGVASDAPCWSLLAMERGSKAKIRSPWSAFRGCAAARLQAGSNIASRRSGGRFRRRTPGKIILATDGYAFD